MPCRALRLRSLPERWGGAGLAGRCGHQTSGRQGSGRRAAAARRNYGSLTSMPLRPAYVSAPSGAARRSPSPHPGAPRASRDTPSARRREGLASRGERGAPRRDPPAPQQATVPEAAGGRLATGTAAPRRARARPETPPRAPPGDAAAQQREIRQRRRAPVGPVAEMMPLPLLTPQPGKRQPWSRWCSARRKTGGIVRVRAPISTTRPSSSWRITTRLASQARRRDVSYETGSASGRLRREQDLVAELFEARTWWRRVRSVLRWAK